MLQYFWDLWMNNVWLFFKVTMVLSKSLYFTIKHWEIFQAHVISSCAVAIAWWKDFRALPKMSFVRIFLLKPPFRVISYLSNNGSLSTKSSSTDLRLRRPCIAIYLKMDLSTLKFVLTVIELQNDVGNKQNITLQRWRFWILK